MIENACRDYLLDKAAAYAKAKGLSLSTVARKLHGSVDFFDKFKAGDCSITLRKLDEMLVEMGQPGPVTIKISQAKKTAVGKNKR